MKNKHAGTNIAIALAVVIAFVSYLRFSPRPPIETTPANTDTSAVSIDSVTPVTNTNKTPKNMKTATIETNKGKIVIEFFSADAPKTTANFVALAEKGFYDNLIFHRVINGFMIQGGDPKGDGTGGPGYMFEDELNPNTPSYKLGYRKGVVAMANAGPNTNGSQFFIMLEDNPLPHNYTIFGRVISGQDVVDAIGNVKTAGAPTDKPLVPIVMKKVTIQ